MQDFVYELPRRLLRILFSGNPLHREVALGAMSAPIVAQAMHFILEVVQIPISIT
jgi:hypothetical protein